MHLRKSLCEVDEEEATSLFQSLTNIYWVNGSTYSCFTHRSHHSTLTVLYIKKYPQSTIIQVAVSLSLTCAVLLACTMHVCRGTKMRKPQRMGENTRHKKLSKNVITFHWMARNNTSRKVIHVWMFIQLYWNTPNMEPECSAPKVIKLLENVIVFSYVQLINVWPGGLRTWPA